MQEFLDKYRDVPRQETHGSIDKPMLIFLGLTLSDFIAGVSVFITVVMFWDSGISIPVAISGACATAILSKFYRNYFPPMFLNHFNWSMGIQKFTNIPSFFRKRRFKSYGP